MSTIRLIALLLLLLQRAHIVGGANTPPPITPPPYLGSCSTQYTGTKFYVAFMQTGSGGNLNLVIYAGPVSSGSIQVTFITDNPNVAGMAPFTSPSTLSSYRPITVRIPIQFQLSESSMAPSNKAFYVNASSAITILGYNEQSNGCDGFLILPTTALGTRYYAATYTPTPSSGSLSQMAIIGTTVQTTTVTITMPSGAGAGTIAGCTPAPACQQLGATLTFTLDNLRVVQLQSTNGDISGAEIISTNPVAVYSGNLNNTSPSTNTWTQAAIQQMLPVLAAGTDYAVAAPLPSNVLQQYAVKVIAVENNIVFNITGQNQQTLATKGSQMTFNFITSDFVRIRSSGPIIVVQLTYFTQPAMAVVPAIRNFMTSYAFAVPIGTTVSSFTNYLVIIATQAVSNELILDGRSVGPGLNWTAVDGSDPSLYAASVSVSPGYHFIYTANQSMTFGAWVFGSSSVCDYWYPTGMCLDAIPSTATASTSTTTITTTTTQMTTSASTIRRRTTPPLDPPSTSTTATSTTTSTTVGTSTSQRRGTPGPLTTSTETARPTTSTSTATTVITTTATLGPPTSSARVARSTPTLPGASTSTASNRETPTSTSTSTTTDSTSASPTTSTSTATAVITRRTTPGPPTSSAQVARSTPTSSGTSTTAATTTTTTTTVPPSTSTISLRPTPLRTTATTLTRYSTTTSPTTTSTTGTSTSTTTTTTRPTTTTTTTTTTSIPTTSTSQKLGTSFGITQSIIQPSSTILIGSSPISRSQTPGPPASSPASLSTSTTSTTTTTTVPPSTSTMSTSSTTSTTTSSGPTLRLTPTLSRPSTTATSAVSSTILSTLMSASIQQSTVYVPLSTIGASQAVQSSLLPLPSGTVNLSPSATQLPSTQLQSSMLSSGGFQSVGVSSIGVSQMSGFSTPLSASIQSVTPGISSSLQTGLTSTTTLPTTTTTGTSTATSTSTSTSTTTTILTTTLAPNATRSLIVTACVQLASQLNPNVSGGYYQFSDTVYRRLDLQLYLFLYADAYFNQFWIVGPKVGSAQATMVSYDTTFPPTNWLTYNGTAFVADRVSISQTCVIGDAVCYSVEFYNPSGNSVYGGVFIYNDVSPQVSSGKPVYRLIPGTMTLYFYYYAPSGSVTGYWIVGPTVGQSSGLIYTTSQIPYAAGVTWFLADGTAVSPPLTLRCYQSPIVAV